MSLLEQHMSDVFSITIMLKLSVLLHIPAIKSILVLIFLMTDLLITMKVVLCFIRLLKTLNSVLHLY